MFIQTGIGECKIKEQKKKVPFEEEMVFLNILIRVL